jgi:malonyl-CoA O-methyltransferase
VTAAEDPWDLDPAAVRAGFERASRRFEQADAVHAEARQRLLERLDWVKLTPALVVDLGSALGEGAAALARRYPEARVLAVDRSPGMLRRARRRQRHGLWPVTGDALRLPLPDACVDLLFANLLLPWVSDLAGLFGEWARVLRPGGVVTFSSLGPDTLHELAQAWAAVDQGPHVHGFFDMHDVGDSLLRSGLVEPVLDVDHLSVTYKSVAHLARELKACGGQNATLGRRRTLTGRHRWQAMVDQYPRTGEPNPIHATVELVFGQAWGRGVSSPADGQVASIPVTDIGGRGG